QAGAFHRDRRDEAGDRRIGGDAGRRLDPPGRPFAFVAQPGADPLGAVVHRIAQAQRAAADPRVALLGGADGQRLRFVGADAYRRLGPLLHRDHQARAQRATEVLRGVASLGHRALLRFVRGWTTDADRLLGSLVPELRLVGF